MFNVRIGNVLRILIFHVTHIVQYIIRNLAVLCISLLTGKIQSGS
jgi:hypothetical protein